MDFKKCTVCKEVKALSQFNTRPDRRSGYRSECKRCQYKRQQKKRSPIKSHAYCAIRRALKAGKITKPTVCEICKNTQKLQAHHPDYNKKLDVIWLCQNCHLQLHWRERILCA